MAIIILMNLDMRFTGQCELGTFRSDFVCRTFFKCGRYKYHDNEWIVRLICHLMLLFTSAGSVRMNFNIQDSEAYRCITLIYYFQEKRNKVFVIHSSVFSA